MCSYYMYIHMYVVMHMYDRNTYSITARITCIMGLYEDPHREKGLNSSYSSLCASFGFLSQACRTLRICNHWKQASHTHLVWRATPQPLITARGRGRARKRSSNYCQFHTSARPMKSPATEMTKPVIGTSRSAGV